MALDKQPKKQEDASDYKDKDAPQWYPGDAGGAQKKPGREQKSNKAPFENSRNDDNNE